MTDLATALNARVLGEFEGMDVLGAGIEIPSAAGGLREALKIDPEEFHVGDQRYVVLEVDCEKVRFDPIKDTNGLRRVHVFKATGATFVDADLVKKHIDEQRERIQRAQDEATGQQSATSEYESQHNAGEHAAELIEGCPLCEAEREAEEAERVAEA